MGEATMEGKKQVETKRGWKSNIKISYKIRYDRVKRTAMAQDTDS